MLRASCARPACPVRAAGAWGVGTPSATAFASASMLLQPAAAAFLGRQVLRPWNTPRQFIRRSGKLSVQKRSKACPSAGERIHIQTAFIQTAFTSKRIHLKKKLKIFLSPPSSPHLQHFSTYFSP
eukprot:scaffold106396_cov45-Phaeocystis_antarctica.AAC.2